MSKYHICRMETSSQIVRLTALSEKCQNMKKQKLVKAVHNGDRTTNLLY